jgi:hypothetical protein
MGHPDGDNSKGLDDQGGMLMMRILIPEATQKHRLKYS